MIDNSSLNHLKKPSHKMRQLYLPLPLFFYPDKLFGWTTSNVFNQTDKLDYAIGYNERFNDFC